MEAVVHTALLPPLLRRKASSKIEKIAADASNATTTSTTRD